MRQSLSGARLRWTCVVSIWRGVSGCCRNGSPGPSASRGWGRSRSSTRRRRGKRRRCSVTPLSCCERVTRPGACRPKRGLRCWPRWQRSTGFGPNSEIPLQACLMPGERQLRPFHGFRRQRHGSCERRTMRWASSNRPAPAEIMRSRPRSTWRAVREC